MPQPDSAQSDCAHGYFGAGGIGHCPACEADLLPDGWKVLVDAPEDMCAEEACWVPVAFASTEKEAEAIVVAEKVAVDCALTVTGKEWWHRDPAYKPDGYGGYRNDAEGITQEYEPWEPCSQFAEGGVELWRVEVEWPDV